MFALVVNGILLMSFCAIAAQQESGMVFGNPSMLRTDHKSTGRCRYDRPYSLLQAYCKFSDFEEIPKNLKSDIRILDLSRNRIRAIKNDSLSSYTSLTYLYLEDNFISDIENGAFENVPQLEVIELNINKVSTFPINVLALPRLRKLYLTNNMINDDFFKGINESLESPLDFIELSMNKLSRLPPLGFSPNLKFLNLSKNYISSIRVEDIATHCSLENLDLSDNPIKFDWETSCDCRDFNHWIEIRGIKMKPMKFDCGPRKDTDYLKCVDSLLPDRSNFSETAMNGRQSCQNVLQMRIAMKKARSIWIIVASCLGVSLLLVFILLYWIHKRNNAKKKAHQRLKLQQQKLASKNANTKLLNANVGSEQT